MNEPVVIHQLEQYEHQLQKMLLIIIQYDIKHGIMPEMQVL